MKLGEISIKDWSLGSQDVKLWTIDWVAAATE